MKEENEEWEKEEHLHLQGEVLLLNSLSSTFLPANSPPSLPN